MSPTPDRATRSGQIFNDLRNLAKRTHHDVAEYLTFYALEGFLARLAASDQADAFVLKGGVLMSAFSARRPTRDLDFLASGFTNDVAECVQRIQRIIAIQLDDGLAFSTEHISGTVIRDEGSYTGVRISFEAHLASARIALHTDVSFGDPVWPAPQITELPLLLGGAISLLSYPDHMVLAEKIVTAIERGAANTRWRDFVDIDRLLHQRTISNDDLAAALKTVAAFRRVGLRPLAVMLEGMPEIAQPKWAAWRRKQHLEDSTPESFHVLLERCATITDTVLTTFRPNLTQDDQTQT